MKLNWLTNGFICKELYAPFTLNKSVDYGNELEIKYKKVLQKAQEAGADEKSLKIIRSYKRRIISALNCYYKADISKCYRIIENCIVDIGSDPIAVNTLDNCYAFPQGNNDEIQFFRARTGDVSKAFKAKDMSFIPEKLRSISDSDRFSIPGNPCLYLANSSYGCWIELGCPADENFNVSPIVLDQTQKVFNLAVMIRDFLRLNEFEENRVHTWLKLLMLSIATSYRINEENRKFKVEYVISQMIMIACKKLGYDGVAYYSKRVDDSVFAYCAINLALFVDYKNKGSSLNNHMKIDDSFNYSIYKKLQPLAAIKEYPLRLDCTGLTTNIGNYDRQFRYNVTDFYYFDKFLFATWSAKPGNHGKNQAEYGEFAK